MEADGQKGHGASRILLRRTGIAPARSTGTRHRYRSRSPTPRLASTLGADLAYPALNLAVDGLAALASRTGIAATAIANSHHFGVAGHQVEVTACKGLVALSFGNGPVAIAPWVAIKASSAPIRWRSQHPAAMADSLVIDMSLSKAARGKINAAAQVGENIPEGWQSTRTAIRRRTPR